MKFERANNFKNVLTSDKLTFIARWWMFKIWENDFSRNIEKNTQKMSQEKVLVKMNSKEGKSPWIYWLSPSSWLNRTLVNVWNLRNQRFSKYWQKHIKMNQVVAATVLMMWCKIYASDTNSKLNMESKTYLLLQLFLLLTTKTTEVTRESVMSAASQTSC